MRTGRNRSKTPPGCRIEQMPDWLAGERAALPPLHAHGALMADRRTVRVHARVSPAELADWPGRPALPVGVRGLA